MPKITEEQEIAIVEYKFMGFTYNEICRVLNHGKTQVSRALARDNLMKLVYELSE